MDIELRSAPALSPRTSLVLASAGALVAGSLIYSFNPMQYDFYPQCLFHQITGGYCPGCGATRAVYALLHGRLGDAIHDNALFVGLLPFALVWAGRYFTQSCWKNQWVPVQFPQAPRWGLALFFLAVGFMILRNLPGPWFEVLRPLS